MVSLATTFEEHVAVLAAESPAAAILEWWRRLDRAVQGHFALVHGRCAKKSHELDKHVDEYPGLGPEVSAQINALRCRRNVIAHEDIASLSQDEAISYAGEALEVIGKLLKAWPE